MFKTDTNANISSRVNGIDIKCSTEKLKANKNANISANINETDIEMQH